MILTSDEIDLRELATRNAPGGTDENGQTHHQIGNDENRVLDPDDVHDAERIDEVDDKAGDVDAGGHDDEPEGDLPTPFAVMAMAMTVVVGLPVGVAGILTMTASACC